ncbi:MAG: hypothetical protein JSU70_20830 [Phycisphaerales bacterium]|nr:MAG: hypothetical protein JSU70_20830 [Phycisphaerales bacterium]
MDCISWWHYLPFLRTKARKNFPIAEKKDNHSHASTPNVLFAGRHYNFSKIPTLKDHWWISPKKKRLQTPSSPWPAKSNAVGGAVRNVLPGRWDWRAPTWQDNSIPIEIQHLAIPAFFWTSYAQNKLKLCITLLERILNVTGSESSISAAGKADIVGGGNLLANPSLEDEFDHWLVHDPAKCRVASVNSPVRNGSASVMAFDRASSQTGIQQNVTGQLSSNMPGAHVFCLCQSRTRHQTGLRRPENSGWWHSPSSSPQHRGESGYAVKDPKETQRRVGHSCRSLPLHRIGLGPCGRLLC